MALCNLIGRRRYHDLNDAVPKLAEKLRVNVLLLQFCTYVRFSVKVLIETNVKISNELNFSEAHPSVNYIGVHSLCMRPSVVYTSINLRKNLKCKLHWVACKVGMNLSGFIHFARNQM